MNRDRDDDSRFEGKDRIVLPNRKDKVVKLDRKDKLVTLNDKSRLKKGILVISGTLLQVLTCWQVDLQQGE